MSPTVAALLGAAAGAMAALVGSIVTNLVTVRNERLRHEKAEHAAYIAALREQAAGVFSAMFAIQHAINWVTWFAKNEPSELDEARIRAYDDEVHAAMPKCLGLMTMVASLNLRVYEEIQASCEVIYELDRRVASALHNLGADREKALRELRDHWEHVVEIEYTLPRQVAHVMNIAEAERPDFKQHARSM